MLRLGCLVVVAALGCRVYDETLLTRADAARDAGADLGPTLDAPSFDIPADLTIIRDDGPPDAGIDATTQDTGDDIGIDAREAGADVPDAVDAPDAPAGCEAVLAGGASCVEAVAGHLWSPDDRRLIAPMAVAVTVDRLLVSDTATGRVMGYDPAGTRPPTRVAGTGTLGSTPDVIAGTMAALSAPSSMVVAGESVIVGDSEAHALYRLRGGQVEPLRLSLPLPTGPLGLAWAPDSLELFVAGDNRVHVVRLNADGGVGSPTALAGRSCGGGCPGFNGDGMPGTDTALAFPTGLAVDTGYVWFADRDNCRVRRFGRGDSTHAVETFIGGECDPSGDILRGAAGDFAARSVVRFGAVTDVEVGIDGSIYVLDDSHCAVVQVLASAGYGLARVVAGSRYGCGEMATDSNPRLGRLGSLTVSSDRRTVYFTELSGQRVGRIDYAEMGGTPRVTFPAALSPGAYPAMTDTVARLRVGRTSALASVSATRWLVGGAAEGRLYQVDGDAIAVLFGAGSTYAPTDAARVIPAAIAPATVSGASSSMGRTLVGVPELGVIGALGDGALDRVAGRWAAPGGVSDAGVGDASGVDPLGVRFVRPAFPFVSEAASWFGDGRGRVWRLTRDSSDAGVVEHFAGAGPDAGSDTDGGVVAARSARIGEVSAVTRDRDGVVYVADRARRVVWSIDAGGTARVVAGVLDQAVPLADGERVATNAAMVEPVALAYDGADTVYIADAASHRVRAYSVGTRTLRTVVGSGPTSNASPMPGGDGGPALMATLARPVALAWDGTRLLIGEAASGRVRALRLPR
ncbi:MAG: hypothetical protein R3A52_12025 [Polyangiales bacterium]